jgi:hypothetical protein
MTTAELLEAIGDGSKFQALVEDVLRHAAPDCAYLVGTGANARGETIVSPLDAFCVVPGSSPPRYVMVETTKTAIKGLRTKWLASKDASEPGDLAKVAREVEAIRTREPNAKFAVYLATNQRPSPDLLTDVYTELNKLNVTIDIWEQSRLAAYLDNTPDGHWLRQKYFNISAQRLSKSLLKEICESSLDGYGSELQVSLDFKPCDRSVDDEAASKIADPSISLCCLIAESGHGKSVAAYKLMDRLLTNGRPALWLPARLVVEGRPLAAVLQERLHGLHPNIEPEAGKHAIELGTSTAPLVVVIDDIARVADPVQTFRRIYGWARANAEDTRSTHPVMLLVPGWPSILRQVIPEASKNRPQWLAEVHIGKLAVADATSLVKEAKPDMTDAEASSLLTHIGLDPFIVGLYVEMLLQDSTAGAVKLLHLADDLCEELVRREVGEVAEKSNSPYNTADLRAALRKLAHWMVEERKFQPRWEDVASSLAEGVVSPLRALVKHQNLVRVSDADGGALVFRHDRLRDALLVDAVTLMLRSPVPPDCVYDPFVVHLVGSALAKSEMSGELLKAIHDKAPMALFVAMRYVGNPVASNEQKIANLAIDWLKQNRVVLPGAMSNFIAWQLVDTDSTFVERVLGVRRFGFLGDLAGARNGIVFCAIRYLQATMADWHVLPTATGDALRDQLLRHAGSYHESRLRQGIKGILKSPQSTPQMIKGALSLLGLLGFMGFGPELDDVHDLRLANVQLDLKDYVLPDLIWAVLRCCDGTTQIVGKLFHLLDRLTPFDATMRTPTLRDSIVRDLCWSLHRYGASEAMTLHLLREARVTSSEALRRDLLRILKEIDHPDVMDFIVEESVRPSPNPRFKFEFDAGGDDLRILSAASRQRLVSWWDNANNSEDLRAAAFDLWLKTTTREDFDVLRKVHEIPFLSRDALLVRIRLGDVTSVPSLIRLLRVNDGYASYLWQFADRVWCKELCDEVGVVLGESDETKRDDFFIAQFLRRIPAADAENLLVAHWVRVGTDPRFVRLAFTVGTKRCRTLATQSMLLLSLQADVFEHIGVEFALPMGGGNAIGLAQLEGIEPYLALVNDDDIHMLVSAAVQSGSAAWVRKCLLGRLDPKARARFFPNQEDVTKALHDCPDASTRSLHELLRSLELAERCGLSKDCIADISIAWMKSIEGDDERRDRVGGECIKFAGSRRHLIEVAPCVIG